MSEITNPPYPTKREKNTRLSTVGGENLLGVPTFLSGIVASPGEYKYYFTILLRYYSRIYIFLVTIDFGMIKVFCITHLTTLRYIGISYGGKSITYFGIIHVLNNFAEQSPLNNVLH